MAQFNTQLEGRKPILLTPGPTEVDPVVLREMSHFAESHFSQPFCDTFGEVLTMLRKLFQCYDPRAQPFVLGGSGSLGWDFTATNFIEPGESVLYLSPGFFDDAFEMCLSTYGARTTKLTVDFGSAPDLSIVEEELKVHQYKALVVTHVDTSTSVLTQLKPLSDLLARSSPETLFIVDGVASVGCEDLQFDSWKVDVVVTGSQKALSCPPGVGIIMVSARALHVAETRKTPPTAWYASLPRWLPIMRKYEKKEASYFATPPTQVIRALHASLADILSRPLSDRFAQHKRKSAEVRAAIEGLGLNLVALEPGTQANGVTAFWLPEGLTSELLRAKALERGIIFAGGMHSQFGSKYVRFGHMGFSVVNEFGAHIDTGIKVLRDTIIEFYQNRSRKEMRLADCEFCISNDLGENAMVLAQA